MYCQSSNDFKFPRRSLCHYPSLKTYSDNNWSAMYDDTRKRNGLKMA